MAHAPMCRRDRRARYTPKLESLESRQLLTTLANPGFEAPAVGQSLVYRPTGAGWSFRGVTGITGNGSNLTRANGPAPEGTQVAFLSGQGTMGQRVPGWRAGTYQIVFQAARRGNAGGPEDFQVRVDGMPVGDFAPVTTGYSRWETKPFEVDDGSHFLQFRGLNSRGGSNLALIDAVQVVAADATPDAPTGTLSDQAGVNLNINGFWSTGPVWTDLAKVMTGWRSATAPWIFDSSIPVDAEGAPLVDAAAGTPMLGYPEGTYSLSFSGTADVAVGGLGHLAAPPTVVNGVTRAQVIVDKTYEQTGAQLFVTFRNVNPADPIRDFHLIMPGYNPANPPTFSRPFLDRLAPFGTVRFMNWSMVSSSLISDWSDRTRPDAVLQTTKAGVAYEYMIELCNETHKDLWLNVPVDASDDYLHRLARLVRNTLDPSLKVYVEYGNELWNTAFRASKENLSNAWANPALTGTYKQQRMGQQYAFMLRHITQIFRAEYGARADSLKFVLGGQAGATAFQAAALKYLASFGRVSDQVDTLSIAPYIGIRSLINEPGLTVDGVFEGLVDWMSVVDHRISINKTLADTYGLPLSAYEGGLDMNTWSGPNVGVVRKALDDPRMGRILESYYNLWIHDGGGLFNQYALNARRRYYGLLEDTTAAGSVEYDAMLAAFKPAGDATGDGRVDYGDFLALAAAYNRPGRQWWANGDFGSDGHVTAADLAILRSQARGLTAQQGVEVSLFGLPRSLRVSNFLYLRGAQDPNLRLEWTVSLGGRTIFDRVGTQFGFRLPTAGTYVVRLTVSNRSGASSTDTRSIVVS